MTTELTDEKCNEFRRLPVSFNDMVRAIYKAGAADRAALTDDEIFLAYTAATGKTLPTLGPSRNELIAISRAVISAHEAKKGGEA